MCPVHFTYCIVYILNIFKHSEILGGNRNGKHTSKEEQSEAIEVE